MTSRAHPVPSIPTVEADRAGRGRSVRGSVTIVALQSGLDREGRSPRHYAAPEGNVAREVTLVAEGEDVNLSDRAGFTPLHFATQEHQAAVASALLAAGALGVDARDMFGETPLSVALFNVRDGDGKVITVLLAAGAEPHAANNYGVSPRELAERVADYDLMRLFR